MKLHLNNELFVDMVQLTAETLSIKDIYVEKDYWVTNALFAIFSNEIGKDTVFKGGTALSKCFKVIERFSEDIDLVVLRREGETDSKLKSKIKAISLIVNTILPEVTIEGITHKMGMNRKTAHAYNKKLLGDFGQIRDVIILESSWLGYYEPYTAKSIISLVGQMMLDNKQFDIAKEYGLLPFDLLTLEPVRTICEKIMSLVRFSYGENPIDELKKKIRHTYDLHQLLKHDELLEFFYSYSFEQLFLKVANDDVKSFKNNNKWLSYHPNEALIFKELDNVWGELKTIYNGDFKNLVYGELPKEKEVFGTLKMIKERLNIISWTIKIESK